MINPIITTNATSHIPTVCVVGGSGVGKSTLIAGQARSDYKPGMMALAGNGKDNTTNCLAEINIDPNASSASVSISQIKGIHEIKGDVLRHLKAVLGPEMKNCMSSRPKDISQHDYFYRTAMERRMEPTDATFRLDKLFSGETLRDTFHSFLTFMLKAVDQKADNVFRKNYFELLGIDKNEANCLLDTLIFQTISPEITGDNLYNDPVIQELNKFCEVVYLTGVQCLKDVGYTVSATDPYMDGGMAEATDLSPDSFQHSIEAVTNSKAINAQSAACIVKALSIRIPGPGLPLSGTEISPYRIFDVVGFDNDGFSITNRVTDALITPVLYDVILFVTKANTMNSHNTEYLNAIQRSVRPSKIVVAVTHFDSTSIYNNDEDPTLDDVRHAVAETRSTMYNLIRTVIDSDCRARLPEKDDIVCFANKRISRLGEGTVEYFSINDSYTLMRKVMADAYKRVHRRLKDHNILPGQRQSFIVPPFALNTTEISNLQKKLESIIQQECGYLRDMSSTYHHWTIDAVLWNFFNEREHVSNAYKWENLHIKIFTKLIYACEEALTPSFASGISISSDADLIRQEFQSNFIRELYKGVREFFLYDINSDGIRINSKCRDKVWQLYLTPKYNKWNIFQQFMDALLLALNDDQKLVSVLDNAFRNAVATTYDRLIAI